MATDFEKYTEFLGIAVDSGVDEAQNQVPDLLSAEDVQALRTLETVELRSLKEIHEKFKTGLSQESLAAWQCNGVC